MNREIKLKLRPAYPRDGEKIREMVHTYASRGLMLPRSLSSIYESIRDFRVIAGVDRIMSCAALQVCWEDMGEIRSLAVIEAIRGKGWGGALVHYCLREAHALKLPGVFTLTFAPPEA